MKAMKKFFHIIFWGLLIAGLVFMIAFVDKKHRDTVVESFELVILSEGEDALTNANDLKAQIIEATDTIAGKTLAEIEPMTIHSILDNNPYVKHADVQTDINGRLMVAVTLRQAISRIINSNGTSYYIDYEGWIMPVNAGHSSRVPVISGRIKDGLNKESLMGSHISSFPEGSVIRNIYKLSMRIIEDEFLNRLISQVYIDSNGEMKLTPMIGDYTIYFGGFGEMDEKFEKLLAYYQKGAGKVGWIEYRSIDLRYKNQVICSK